MRKVAENAVTQGQRSIPSGPRARFAAIGRASLLLVIAVTASALASAVPAANVLAAPVYPEAAGNVNDFAKILSSEDRKNLDALIDSVLDQTGATLAVATLANHEGESLEVYAAKLYEKWGIGKKGEDKGLLLLVTIEERETRMEVGYGLEGVVTDRRAGEALDKMTPYFQKGEYGKGIYAGLLHVAGYVAKDAGVDLKVAPVTKGYEPVVNGPNPAPLLLGVAVLVAIPTLLVVAYLLRGQRCPQCKSRLTVTDRVVQRATYDAAGLALKVLHCPRCGYHSEKPFTTGRLTRPGTGGMPPIGGGPFFGGSGRGAGGGFSGPRGFGGGRSGGGGASRKW